MSQQENREFQLNVRIWPWFKAAFDEAVDHLKDGTSNVKNVNGGPLLSGQAVQYLMALLIRAEQEGRGASLMREARSAFEWVRDQQELGPDEPEPKPSSGVKGHHTLGGVEPVPRSGPIDPPAPKGGRGKKKGAKAQSAPQLPIG